MTMIRPQNVPVARLDGSIVEVPDVTILAWASAMKLEVAGMQLSRGRSCSAMIKDTLGLPKSMKKKEVLEIVTDLKDQLMAAAAA